MHKLRIVSGLNGEKEGTWTAASQRMAYSSFQFHGEAREEPEQRYCDEMSTKILARWMFGATGFFGRPRQTH